MTTTTKKDSPMKTRAKDLNRLYSKKICKWPMNTRKDAQHH
jgi:hypothetical protein